jgi:hypothetical protein
MLQPGYFIDHLGLKSHVEGGYYKELYRNDRLVGSRPLASTIYYLLKSGQVSRFHRLKSDEIWVYHYGSPLRIVQLNPDGSLSMQVLGMAVARGERPQITVPGGAIFGAEVVEPASFCLVSCLVSPGFDERDFELFSEAELERQFPQHRQVIRRFSEVENIP